MTSVLLVMLFSASLGLVSIASSPQEAIHAGVPARFGQEQTVTVHGLVNRPGVLKFVDKMTVSEAVAAAGGLVESVKASDVFFVVTSGLGKARKDVTVEPDHRLSADDAVTVRRKRP